MKNKVQKHLLNERFKRKRRRKLYYSISVTAAAIVVFCTVYALTLPAITLEKQQEQPVPVTLADSAAWGHNDDGSIWWNSSSSFQQISSSADINENTSYIIAGRNRVNVLTNQAESTAVLKTYRPTANNAAAYQPYELWYFEPDTSGYYIHTEANQYLKLSGESLSLTEKAEATVFALGQSGESADCITLKAPDGYYLNTYGSDSENCSGWAGWNEDDSGSALQIVKTDVKVETANPVKTATSPNTVMNLFDYWLSDSEGDRFNQDNVPAPQEAGINKDHAFKFVREQNDSNLAMNIWTGAVKNPRQGIVANTLGEDGYPRLSGDNQINGTDATESLGYLFDPELSHPGKVSFKNVGSLFSIDNEGYYSYDCEFEGAEYQEEDNSFHVYDKPTVGGQFFPFNDAPEIMEVDREYAGLNHYYGATITTRFVHKHGGFTDDGRDTPTTFEFSGDDDVWIFIDGVLVGDVGGIHDESSVKIDFSSGQVTVMVNGGSNPLNTTLKDCYINAGKYKENEWTQKTDGQFVYKDGTIHTLKFFFLERGNYSSNMRLKYNLTEIPDTAIYKVNQYGEEVSGATFAVYAADNDYHMLSHKGGTQVDLPAEYGYDENGNIKDAAGNILASSLYTGTTNHKGEMIFTDSEDMPYSINELQELFGNHFILREIKVPDGYRVVNKDVHLQIWQGESQKILKCDNTRQSGSHTASTLQITATDMLYLDSPYNGSETLEYCNANGETVGTLFAVVFKYIGDTDENGNALSGINDDKSWAPLYGNDKEGYTIMNTTGGLIKSALAAAVKAQEYGNVVFRISSSGTMQLMMENLPGDITSYYRMLSTEQKRQARYTVGYYWTPAGSLEEATEETTYRVNTFAEASADGIHYSGFERVFGANIQVPNLINKVLVQKVDEDNNLINGATFAIYQVKQSADGTIQYRLADGSYAVLPAEAVIGSDGVITSGGITVTPLKTDITKNYSDNIHTGTAEFAKLNEGQYMIKEVKPPPGYRVNTADIMLLVTEDTIYANAGTADDGVTVGRGPGYLASTLNQFASEGQIDNTLSWIYAQMRISKESTSFADVGNPDTIKGYLKKNNSDETTDNKAEAFKTYLEYAADKEGTAFNYVPDPDRNPPDSDAPTTDGYRRLFTTVGWPYYEVYQDYAYGKEHAEKNNANYNDWSQDELAHLFSRSTYIRVTDEQQTTVTVKKVDEMNQAVSLSGAQFRLYKKVTLANGTEEILYYRWDSQTKSAQWTRDENEALTVTTGEDGMPDGAFIGLKDGTYFLEEIRPPDGYYKPSDPVQFTITHATLTVDSHTDITVTAQLDGTTNLYTYTLAVPNRSGFVLPATGGGGTTLYTIGGFLLMAAPFVYGYRKKRRCERKD